MKNKKYILKWVLMLSVMALAVNLCLDLCFFRNYQDKMHILGQVLEEDERSRLDMFIGLLKHGHDDLEQSNENQMKEILRQYGYAGNVQNNYYAGFVKQCVTAGACSVILMLLVLFFAYMQEKRWYMVQQRYFKELEHCLIRFRENEIMGQDILLMPDAAEGLGDAVMRVNDQLTMLAEYLTMMCGQSRAEKEGTKSLVTDISHQLKTPVAALDTCFSVLAEQELSDQEKDEFYKRCRNEMEGLKSLLDSLIQISRMEAGMIQLECKRAPILDTIVMAVNRIYPRASDKQLELIFDHETSIEQLQIEHDTRWMCEAFINILDNAVKYSPAGSEIRIFVQ